MKYHKTLFIFRRDLRLEDNTGLIHALRVSRVVMPCFILDPRQISDQPYYGQPAVTFMITSLNDLEGQLQSKETKLFIFEGRAHDVVESLIKKEGIDAVVVNWDYTPFSKQRDEAILKVCQMHGAAFMQCHDALLDAPGTVKKDDGTPYSVYTPYARKAMTHKIPVPVKNDHKNYYTGSSMLDSRNIFDQLQNKVAQSPVNPGGREEALKILRAIKDRRNYDQERDIPSLQGTTRLSSHHKFGTVSVRETYHAVVKALGISHTLIRELYWRDFFTQIGYHFPHVLGKSFYPKYDKIVWEHNEKFFQAWCEGNTGFPIVDAGMRELNVTGFMHNRVRMITASFLIKDLHIDWRQGERYFAQHLVDYDPLVNNGNWQWAASTGCDAAPYFRIFNPWLQQKKFDPDARYIKQWVPALRQESVVNIHDIAKKGLIIDGYPPPIVWHEHEKSRALDAYGKV